MCKDPKLHKLAAEFFREFSRTEYALKASGFHKGNGVAQANWCKFAKKVNALIDEPDTDDLALAIKFIFEQPPKKQIIRDDQIEWTDATLTCTLKADNLLTYVRRVRNNLFHGNKLHGRSFEPERSELLLRHSLVILRSCVASVPDVEKAYFG